MSKEQKHAVVSAPKQTQIPAEVQQAYAFAKRQLFDAGFELEQNDLPIVVMMHEFLSHFDPKSKPEMVRRWSDLYGGLWTIKYKEVEYDPTILLWPEMGGGGGLYVVTDKSPHNKWKIDEGDKSEYERGAYDITRDMLVLDGPLDDFGFVI